LARGSPLRQPCGAAGCAASAAACRLTDHVHVPSPTPKITVQARSALVLAMTPLPSPPWAIPSMSYCVVAVFYYQDIDAEGRLCGLGLVLRVRHEDFDVLLRHGFYGASKKQGVSVRMPLSACNPTRLCAGACYAHDVL